MPDQYFARRPRAPSRRFTFPATVRGQALTFASDRGVFSKDRADPGTSLLAAAVEIRPGDTVLDLGCGIGVLGIALARATEARRVWMTDVNERALRLARDNARTNGVAVRVEVLRGAFYSPVAGLRFDHVVTNPPLRAGRATVARIIDDAPKVLNPRGSLWLVARTRQGARPLEARMLERFGTVETVRRGGGYRVLRSRLTDAAPGNA